MHFEVIFGLKTKLKYPFKSDKVAVILSRGQTKNHLHDFSRDYSKGTKWDLYMFKKICGYLGSSEPFATDFKLVYWAWVSIPGGGWVYPPQYFRWGGGWPVQSSPSPPPPNNSPSKKKK